MSMTDEHIDELFRKGAENLSFEYKDAYWSEMNEMLSDAATVSGSGVEEAPVDEMFKAKADSMSFAYKPEYWSEMEAMLPTKRRPDFLWFFTSLLFIGLIGFNLVDNFSSSEMNSERMANESSSSNDNSSNKQTNQTENSDIDAIDQEQLVIDLDQLNLDWLNDYNWDASNYWMPTCGGDIYPMGYGNPDLIGMIGMPGIIEGTVEVETDEVDDLAPKKLEGRIPELASQPAYDGKVKATANMYVQAVGGLSQSLITPSEALSYSYGIGAGIEIKKRNFSFAAGANLIVSNHNDLELSRTAKVYGFGSEVYHFNMDYKQLYLIEGNLELGYAFKRHNVKIGVRPSYTFSSKVKVSELGLTYTQADVADESATRSHYGYMDGLKRLGIKPMIGYSYNLRPDMTLGMNMGVQLMPMVNEEYIDGVNNKFPIDAQLYFRKTINFRK